MGGALRRGDFPAGPASRSQALRTGGTVAGLHGKAVPVVQARPRAPMRGWCPRRPLRLPAGGSRAARPPLGAARELPPHKTSVLVAVRRDRPPRQERPAGGAARWPGAASRDSTPRRVQYTGFGGGPRVGGRPCALVPGSADDHGGAGQSPCGRLLQRHAARTVWAPGTVTVRFRFEAQV